MLFNVAIFVIYIVLGILYESFLHPLTILSGIGLVKKNAIMMIDFAQEAERRHGLGAFDAIVEACLVRFRSIMMTTMAALIGARARWIPRAGV